MFSLPFLPFTSNKIAAIDIGHQMAKVVQLKLKKDKQVELLRAGRIELPQDVIENGQIIDPSIVASRLDDLFDTINFTPERVITTIASQNVIIRNINMPNMSEDELKEAVKWEVEDYLPFPLEQAIFDYIITERHEEGIDLILVAAPRDVIASYISVLERLYIKPLTVNAQALGLLSLLAFQNKIDKPSAVIDIGAANTRVIIGDKDKIYLSRTVERGGLAFTRKLEQSGFDFNEAEELKKEIEIKVPGEEESGDLDFELALAELETEEDNGKMLHSVAVDLAAEVARSLEYYRRQHRGELVENVFITGGGSRLSGLKEIIEDEIGRELKDLKPLNGLNTASEIPEEIINDLAVVIGLALSEVVANES